ncbi:MAG: DEAD/DEAH box helicase family protein [Oscillospiraceae bacterium]|nr:DEAD/DEAH box helicase family protein [Oscillospiraceae bacterium]
MGTSEDVLLGQRSDAGEGIDSGDDTLTEKVNRVFSDTETEEAPTEDSVGASFVDPYLAARQTDTPVIELPEYGIRFDLRELRSVTVTAETEEIVQHDESEVERQESFFRYDPELLVIVLDVSHDNPDLIDYEEMLTVEEAAASLRELMKPMRNTVKTLVALHPDGTEEHLEEKIEHQQVDTQKAVSAMLSAFRAQAGEISPERMTELTEDKLLIPAVDGDVDSSVTFVNFSTGEHVKPEEAAKMMQENPELAISSVVVRLIDEKMYPQRSDRGLVAVDRLNAEEFASLCAHTDAEYVQQSFGYKRMMMHVKKRAETDQAAVDSLVRMLSDPEQLPGVLDHCFARDELEEIDQQFRNAADFDAWEAIARKALEPAGYSVRISELKSDPYFENGFHTYLHVRYEGDQVELSVQEQSVSLSIREVADAIAKAAHDYMAEEEPVLTTRDILDAEVLRGTGFVGGKERVQDYYDAEKPDVKQLASFLKKEYGTGGHTGNGQHFMTDYDAGGMWIRMRNGESTKFNWNQVAEVALTHLAANTYLTPEEQQERQMLRVYQLKQGEQYHGIRYMSLADNADKGLNQDDYDLVYECRWGDIPGKTNLEKLERIYTILNTERPEDYAGRSLSMSDVLTVGDTAYYVDTVGFQEMPDFALKMEDKYHFYVIADLKTWANNENPRSKLEMFDTLDEALSRFKVLHSEPYNSENALNEDNQPYARLTLGVSRQDRTGDLDILHVRAGQNYLVTDFMRSPGFSDDPLFMKSMRCVAGEVGFDRVTDYEKLPDGRWSNAIDVSFAEWLDHKGVSALVPMPQQPYTLSENDIIQNVKYGDDSFPAPEPAENALDERATYSTNPEAAPEQYGEQMSLFDEPKIYQLVTYDADSGADYKKDYATLDEAVEAGRQYLADGYDGFAILNTEEHKIKAYEGDFPLTGVFTEQVYKNSGEWHESIPAWNGSPIHYGFFGNGITAYDTSRRDPETNDFPTVAHISDEGKVTIYDETNLTDYDRDTIAREAENLRKRFERDWNSRSIEGRYQAIIDRADWMQMQQISADELPMAEKVAKYEQSVIFGNEPFPENTPENTDAAEHTEADVHRFAEAMGLNEQQLSELLAANPAPETINQYGRLNKLIDTMDRDKAASVVDPENLLRSYRQNMRIDLAVRNFVLYGTMPEALRQEQTASRPEPEERATYSTNPPEPEKKHKPTRAERLYKQFCEQFPAIADGSHTYERYGSHDDASGWEPLSVEHLGENQYGFMTTYIQNGDLMRDPDFVIELDHENKTLHVLEYQQDGVPPVGTVYERVYDEFGKPDRKLQAALEENFMVKLRNAGAANRALHVYEDAEGRHELVPEVPEQEPEQKPDDPNPELRAVLNAFSEKHGLGALQVTPGRYGSELGEIMQDGAVHPLGTLFGNDNGKPFTPDTLQKALENLEGNLSARGEDFTDIHGRQTMLSIHGGMSALPEVQKDLPEIFYADSPSMRISNNISAIREMLRLEQAERDGTEPYDPRSNQYNSRQNSEGRLRQYCGWGGLPQVFDERFPQYDHYRKELQKMLTPEEYAAARASTMNAHYTPQIIIDAMYKAVQSMGLSRDSRILEPSCGTGNFISRMPHSIGQGGVVGVELDSITARIAAQLNKEDPNVHIIESGFEHADLANNSFDLAVGNIPFGNYNLNDPAYTQDWLIHDAFFRRALDKVAPGGVVAFVTSSGTLDKANPKVREYLAERADLIGAIRLPNTAFKDAGTKVTSDIIFLQKRAEPLQPFDRKPDWCYTMPNADGLQINSYFVQNPQMVLGTMRQTSYYDTLTCDPIEGADFAKQLDDAVSQLNAKITIIKREQAARERRGMIEPWGKNFTYQIKDGRVYYRQGEDMQEVKRNAKDLKQIMQLCELRTITRELLDKQKTPVSDAELAPMREKLNAAYDTYVKEHGVLNTQAVKKLFGTDADFPILQSLETFDKESGKYQKADIFFRRTVNPTSEITSAETVEEALQVSLDKKGKPDVPYMAVLLSKEADAVCSELLDKGLIFMDPEKMLPDAPFSGVTERSEYLSGNVRRKLTMAQDMAKQNPDFDRNVKALTAVIPADIKAEEISVRMGCAWIDPEDYTKFLTHLSGRRSYAQRCEVSYSSVTGEFDILNAGSKQDLNQNESVTYGTKDLTMYELAKRILNQRRIVVYKEMPDPKDPTRTVTRTDATATKIAIEKANAIKAAFKEWIFADPERKAKYERRYNDIFNSLVGREYDGSKLTFDGLVSDFALRPHQKDCVARAIYGGNTLAAHVVGAGKSAVMFSTVMKKKALGLISKACVVVPKPLTEQVAREWRSIYPDARLLVVTNDDLSTEAKRNLFTARVATGSYDAVIMSQEQFEKIPMSRAYRTEFLMKELDSLEDMLREKKLATGGKRDYSVKAIERAKKQLAAKIEKLTNAKSAGKAKDDLLEFEHLGFDYLVVDEAHAYKNGFVTTKMTNVAGVTSRPSGRAEDMQMKTDYFNDHLGLGHLLLCTGTPVSNSMTELYVMTRYLRPDLLRAAGVERFDDWAATFGNVVAKNQQGADGTLKLRTCFATFANLPELMAMYKEFADVQSADKLHLPRPELKTGKPQIVSVPASPEQKAYVQELAERAAMIAAGRVEPHVDNLLKITGEARLIGLGNRAIKALYEKRGEEVPFDFVDSKDSKVDRCVENVAEIYQRTVETKGVQIIFSDIAVNADNGNFSVYDYIKSELIAKGIPEEEIIFAPKSDSKERENIFRDINEGKYRVVIASTGTLGTGANIQQNLYALHHIDVPWKPSAFEQREGRILRQGNQNPEVEIFNYVTEGTLDSYLYQTVTDKARFIAQLLDDECPARVMEDCDEKVLTFGEIQAAAEGNPDFKRRIELANEIAELTLLQKAFHAETAEVNRRIEKIPEEIASHKEHLALIQQDETAAKQIADIKLQTAEGRTLTERKDINAYLLDMVQHQKTSAQIGGFKVSVVVIGDAPMFEVRGASVYHVAAGETEKQDNMQRLANFMESGIAKAENNLTATIIKLETDLQQAQERSMMTFPHADDLEQKQQELAELEQRLSGLRVQEDALLDPEEDADPIIETAEEAAERKAQYGQPDSDDVAPGEIPKNDDRMEPRMR